MTSEDRTLAALRAAMGAVSAYHYGRVAAELPEAEVQRTAVLAMGEFSAVQILIPLVTITLGACELAAQARGEPIESVIQHLGAMVAGFEAEES